MSLTGVPLLVLAAMASVALLAGTVVGWRRVGSRRPAVRLSVRAGGIVFAETLVLVTVGLAANRALGIYPSWASLFDDVRAAHVTARPPSALDDWLHKHAQQGARDGLTFTWRPAAERTWHLTAPPEITLPTAYFRDPTLAFPVVVAVASAKASPATGAWDDRRVDDAAAAVPGAVVVFVRPADAIGAHNLTVAVPAQLVHDLRVLPVNWVVVGVGPQMTAALDAAGAPGGPYASVGLVCEAKAGPAPAVLDRLRLLPTGQAGFLVAPAPMGSITPARISVVTRPENRLSAVLAWAQSRLPPPLNPPVVAPPMPGKPASAHNGGG